MLSRFGKRPYVKPPSYFSEANGHAKPMQMHHMPHTEPQVKKPFIDMAMIICVGALSFFAYDNYRARVALEAKQFENTMQQMKATTQLQTQFNAARKKRELQIINERKSIQKREMKMALHIAMLRQQLESAGVKAVSIEEAVQEFEKNVKMETSISNVSGTSLWVVDESATKSYMPSVQEYDKKK